MTNLHTTQLTYALFLFIAINSIQLSAVSLTDVSSWINGTTKERITKEFKLSPGGTVIIENNLGTVTIKPWSFAKVAVEGTKLGKEADLSNFKIETHLEGDTLTIKTVTSNPKTQANVDYVLMVPEHVNLKISTGNDVRVKKIKGKQEIHSQNGNINLDETGNSLFAKTHQGSVTVHCSVLPLNSTLNISSDNGPVTLSLPATVHADIFAKTEQGCVTSEQYINVAPQMVKLEPATWKKFKQEVRGRIGNGGSIIKLETMNGNIKLLEH